MSRICRSCLSTLHEDAIYCDQCGARAGVRAGLFRRGWLVALLLVAALAALVVVVMLLDSSPDRIATAPREDDAGIRDDDQSHPAARSDAKSTTRAPTRPTPSSADAVDDTVPGVLDLESVDSSGAVVAFGGGARISADEAIIPITLLFGAIQLVGVECGVSSRIKVVAVLALDIESDLALVRLEPESPRPPLTLAEPRSPPDFAARIQIDRQQAVRIKLPEGLHVGSDEPGARVGDPLLDRQGHLSGLMTRPALARELDSRTISLDAESLVAVAIDRSRLQKTTSMSLEEFSTSFFARTPRSLFAAARDDLSSGRAASAWTAVGEILGLVPMDAIPDLRALHRAVATTHAAELEEMAPGGGLQVLTLAVQNDPNSFDLVALQARSLARVGDRLAALSCYRGAILLDPARTPEVVDALLDVHVAHFEAARLVGGYAEVIDEAQKSLALIGEQGGLRYLIGMCQLETGETDAGLAELEAARKLDASLSSLIDSAIKATLYEPPTVSEGETTTFARGAQTIVVDVLINGNVRTRMVVDTGASSSAISTALARELGLRIDSKLPKAKVTTAGGIVEAPIVDLESIAVGSHAAAHLEVLVLDIGPAHGAEGLLGNDFLGRFRVTIDADAGTLTLQPR